MQIEVHKIIEIIQQTAFQTGFFSLAIYILVSHMSLSRFRVHFFLLLNNIPFYVCIAVCLFIHLLKNIFLAFAPACSVAQSHPTL